MNEKEMLLCTLDEKERGVFDQLLEGYTRQETAANLGLSESEVRGLADSVFSKLKVDSARELIIGFNFIRKKDIGEI